MAKIERKYMAHYIEVGGACERLGKDLEEFSPSMSAQMETKKNILGESCVLISGYEKTASVDTYYADKESLLFQKLQEIVTEGKILDDLRVNVVEVRLWEGDIETDTMFPATCEEAYIEVNSYGGDTTGYQIPFTLHYTGNKTQGTFNLDSHSFEKI